MDWLACWQLAERRLIDLEVQVVHVFMQCRQVAVAGLHAQMAETKAVQMWGQTSRCSSTGMQHPGRQIAQHSWGVAPSLKCPQQQQQCPPPKGTCTTYAVWAPSAKAPPTWADIQFWYRKAWRAKDQLFSTIMLFMVTNMTSKGVMVEPS